MQEHTISKNAGLGVSLFKSCVLCLDCGVWNDDFGDCARVQSMHTKYYLRLPVHLLLTRFTVGCEAESHANVYYRLETSFAQSIVSSREAIRTWEYCKLLSY